MGGVTSIFASKQTYSLDEQNKIREERLNFNDKIQYYYNKALELKEKSELTPESTDHVIVLNNEASTWLSENASATVLDIQVRKDKYIIDVKNTLETDKAKADFKRFYNGLLLFLEQNDVSLSKKEKEILRTESTIAQNWLKEHETNTTLIKLEVYIYNARTRTVGSMENTNSKKLLNDFFDDLKKKKPTEVENDLEKIQEARETLENNRFDINVIFDEAWNTGLKIIVGSLIFLVFLFSGSLAANSVIYRSTSIRVLYFIWGMFPLFTIPILIYFGIQRIRSGPLRFYGLLPILESTEIYENGLGFFERFIRKAVVYYKDDEIAAMIKNYCDTVKNFRQ